jgi:N-glycosylase/DNA lyase
MPDVAGSTVRIPRRDIRFEGLNMPRILTVDAPSNFDFRTAVRGHGWFDLRPFVFDDGSLSLVYANETVAGNPFGMRVTAAGRALRIETDSPSGKAAVETVRRILRLDEDLSEFHRMAKGEPELKWVVKKGGGRLLRSATVFEDLVKTICTTNCSWSLTRVMTANLVERLGREAKGFGKAFPTAEALAEASEKFLRDEIRAGYRAPYLKEVATRVARREIDPESWLDSSVSIAELKREIKGVKGVGDYAAENLLKLLGRYEGLALDSWLRARFKEKHNGGRPASDPKIERFYARFGRWRGLAIWCDLSGHWH